MPDPLQIVHSAEQPTFEELREQFRAANRARIHAMLRKDTMTFRDKLGQHLRDKLGNIVRRATGYLTDAPPGRDHRRLDEFRQQGGTFAVSNEFKMVEGSGLDHELADLVRDANAFVESERVEHPEVKSLEGPPLASLDDDAVVNYIDQQKEHDGPEKCSPEATSAASTASTEGAWRDEDGTWHIP